MGTSANLSFAVLKGVYSTASRITGEFKDTREKQKLRCCSEPSGGRVALWARFRESRGVGLGGALSLHWRAHNTRRQCCGVGHEQGTDDQAIGELTTPTG